MFHADATFKLSYLEYPSITCGFTDASRWYQLAAIFVVSRRTAHEYALCLRALVSAVSRIAPSARLYIDFSIGDAEDAQYDASQRSFQSGIRADVLLSRPLQCAQANEAPVTTSSDVDY